MLVFFVVKRRKTKRFSTDSVDLPAPLRSKPWSPYLKILWENQVIQGDLFIYPNWRSLTSSEMSEWVRVTSWQGEEIPCQGYSPAELPGILFWENFGNLQPLLTDYLGEVRYFIRFSRWKCWLKLNPGSLEKSYELDPTKGRSLRSRVVEGVESHESKISANH